jgi:PAS domain S-box-containing protein
MSPSADDSTDTIRVLHVDDEPDFADLTATFLEREDGRIEVRTATAPEEGLDILSDRRIDCVVSDYEMPGTNGIEFLEAVRETYPDLPFVLFTGKGSEEVASEAVSAGVTDYLQKQRSDVAGQYELLARRITNVVEASRSSRLLKERTRKLETLISNLPGMVYQALNEPGWPMKTVEGEVKALTGYPAAAIRTNEVVWGTEVIHPDDREPMWEAVQGAIDEDRPFEVTYRIVTKDGDTKWVWERGQAVYDDGELSALEGFITDITEREEYQERLREEQQFVQSILRSLPDPLYAFDTDGYSIRWNERFEAVSGYAGDEIEGMHVTDFIPEEEVERIAATFDSILEERRSMTVESVIETKDGNRIPFELTGRPLEDADGALRGITGIGRDITEREGRERQLEALNRATRRLLTGETPEEVAGIGVELARDVIGLDVNAVHLYDETSEELRPVAATDRVSELIGDLPTFTPGDSIAWRAYERGEARAVDTVQDDPDIYNPDTPIRSELYLPLDEYGILIAGSSTPAAFDQQDVLVGEILARNVTTALEHVERTEQLRARERELSSQNDQLEQFASIISHDLRNPLNVAEGRLELGRTNDDNEHLAAVADAHDRMRALIEDLLALAREGDEISDLEPIDLGSILKDCWRNVETADATLVNEASGTVRGDESRLKQLFENLVRNSVEHGSTGDRSQTGDSVEHSSTSSRTGSDDAVEHGADDVTITVGELTERDGFDIEDDGPGIPPDERETVFEAGYSTSRDGTGFGLSIVKRIVDAHGWEISVTESHNGGARFEITGVEFVDR